MALTLHTDGGARGNPGPAGIGFVLYDGAGSELLASSSFLGNCTNNFAEYEALIRGLEATKKYVQDHGIESPSVELTVKLDSELVVRQLNGIYKVKDAELKKQCMRVQALRAADFPRAVFLHVRREQNKRADELANEAMDEGGTHGHI